MSKPSNESINIRYKKEVQLRKSMEEAVKTVDARIAQAVAQEGARVKAEYEEKLRNMALAASAAVEEVDQETRKESSGRRVAESKLEELERITTGMKNRILNLEMEGRKLIESRDMYKEKADTAEPTIRLLKLKVTDLTTLNDKVRGRMRKKELEEEAAILNRQVLSGSTPGFRRA